MKTSKRFPPLVAAFALAASVAAMPGCATTDAPSRPRSRAVAVNVIVTYNAETGKGEMTPSDKIVEISERYRDFVQWASPDGIVHVKWVKGSPFDANPVHERKVLKSRPPKKGTAGQGFDYTMELELPNGTHVEVVDPRVEVID